MARVVLFGIGSTAQVMHYHLSRESWHCVEAFTVDAKYLRADRLAGLPVVPFEDIARRYPPDDYEMMIAVGYAEVNRLRARRCAEARALGYRLISYVSPTATLWAGLELGGNCKVGAGSLLQPFSRIGDDVFIGSGCIVSHHTVIEDHCFLGSGVMLGGGVIVESHAFLGTGVTVRNKARIGAHGVVGAGAVVLEDTRPHGVYVARGAEALDISSDALSPG
ncbi:MAG: NeuD/PglB/VioB family sugar acetyltransferase [Candidatus Contendobacter sp.]|nr:NeuD/PglB/VioB family sugar acetyltransferase [Candidatus Contendobacter sp.]